MKREKLKWGISTLLFLLIFLMLFSGVSGIFRKKHTKSDMIHSMYAMKENDLDLVVVGSSHAYFGYSPNEMWAAEGITSYMLGCPAQTVAMAYYALREILKTQNPKVIMLDAYGFQYEEFCNGTGHLRLMLDSIPLFDGWKLNTVKTEAIEAALPDASWREKMTYYIPLSKYHGRWGELKNLDFHPENAKYYKGGRLSFYCQPFDVPPQIEGEGVEIPQLHLEYFDRIVQLCQEKGIELVVYFTPIAAEDLEWYTHTQRMMISIKEMLEEKGIPFVNCQWNEKVPIDYATDFQDEQHINYYGQVKVTDYLGSWLKEHYQLEDHRRDEAYSEWQREYEKYRKEAEKKEKNKEKEKLEVEGAEE